MGMVIATYFVKKGEKPKYCIFTGVPIDESGEVNELEKNLKGYDIPTTFIQNTDEKFIKPKELEEKLTKIKVVEFEVSLGKGKEHAYNVEEIVETAKKMNQKYGN